MAKYNKSIRLIITAHEKKKRKRKIYFVYANRRCQSVHDEPKTEAAGTTCQNIKWLLHVSKAHHCQHGERGKKEIRVASE